MLGVKPWAPCSPTESYFQPHVLVSWDKLSLCSPSWPGTCCVICQADRVLLVLSPCVCLLSVGITGVFDSSLSSWWKVSPSMRKSQNLYERICQSFSVMYKRPLWQQENTQDLPIAFWETHSESQWFRRDNGQNIFGTLQSHSQEVESLVAEMTL